VQIHLVAVQPKLALRDFARLETFAARMEALLERAVEGLDRSAPTLVVLPEDLGLYLGFVPYHWRAVSGDFVPHPEDFVSLIQGRESIQYGVGAFLVGEVFEDMRAEGLSFIARNTGDPEAPWQDAIVARAEQPFEEAIVRATVDLAERSTGGSAAY